jgi:Cu/Ag efflux pump CusA
MWVTLDGSTDYDTTRAAIGKVASGYPGMRHEVLAYSQERMREVLGREGNQVTIRVFGDDFGVLYDRAGEIKRRIAGIDGVTDARVTSRAAEPTIEVQVDLAKARVAGIKPGDVRRAAATLLSGLRVGNLFQDQKVFDVVVWSNPSSRRSLSSVESLLIDTPTGGHTRLGDVANVRIRPTLPDIEHQDISRFVDVTASVRGRDVVGATRAVRAELDGVKFPLEYHAEVLGDYAAQQDAQRRLLAFVIAAAIGVFLLLQAAFSSWRLAGIASLMVAVALSGGVLATRLDGGTVTLATMAGLLAVFIVSVRSSLLFVDRVRRLRDVERLDFGVDLVERAAGGRFAPTVATALTTVVALLPAILMANGPGLEVVRSMAVVLIAGLGTALVASLLLLPALYLHFGPRFEPREFEADDVIDPAHFELSTAERVPIVGVVDS